MTDRSTNRRRRSIRTISLASSAVALITLVTLGIMLRQVSNREPSLRTDYVAIYNADTLSLAPTDRAFPIYQQAYAILDSLPSSTSPEYDEAIDERRRAFDFMLEASTKEQMGIELPTDPDTPPSLLQAENAYDDDLVHHRAMEVFNERTEAIFKNGDTEAYLDALLARIRIGRHFAEVPWPLGDGFLDGLTIASAVDIMKLAVALPDAVTSDRIAEFDRLFRHAVEHEVGLDTTILRLWFLDVVQWSFDGNGRFAPRGVVALCGDGSLAQDPPLDLCFSALFSTDRDTVVDVGLATLDHLETRCKTPFFAWNGPDQSPAERFLNPNRLIVDSSQTVLLTVMTDPDSSHLIAQQRAQILDATLLTLAAVRHRQSTGAWPASLDDIDEALLPEVPLDRFDGQPLRYRRTDAGPLIYSVGMDGDDDNGRPARNAMDWKPNEERDEALERWPERYDGDWVLFPPQDDND
ncbi:MAG: hypothetical protein CMJ31_05350 [Phycisphaerae bacterium]|nr:hypothetical protein [Phycisphaerae bacterium]